MPGLSLHRKRQQMIGGTHRAAEFFKETTGILDESIGFNAKPVEDSGGLFGDESPFGRVDTTAQAVDQLQVLFKGKRGLTPLTTHFYENLIISPSN